MKRGESPEQQDKTKRLAKLAANRAKKGLSTPIFENRPELYEDLACVYEAFICLSRVRPVGFSIGAIPITEIVAWMDLHNIKGQEEREDFYLYINAMDGFWLDWQSKKTDKKSKKGA